MGAPTGKAPSNRGVLKATKIDKGNPNPNQRMDAYTPGGPQYGFMPKANTKNVTSTSRKHKEFSWAPGDPRAPGTKGK